MTSTPLSSPLSSFMSCMGTTLPAMPEADGAAMLTAMLTVPGSIRQPGAVRAACRVRMLVLDVDGVCTDGRLVFSPDGQASKAFHSRDGIGIKTALRCGLNIGVITGRDDACVRARMTQLGVREYYPGHESKLAALALMRDHTGLAPEEMAYLGDDWIDLDPMRAVGLPMAVADAALQVRVEAAYVTAAGGGQGAVREAVEFLLAARGGFNPANVWIADQADTERG